MADSENRIAHPMNEALTALNGNAGALLVVMSLGILLFLATLTYHTVELRRERRAQSGQLAEQLGRTMAGLQKINSSIIAQTNETKERLGTLRPAIEQADQMLRDATNFTTDFKAVRGELRQLGERLDGLNLAATQSAAAQAEVTGAVSELKQHLGALRQEVATAPQPEPAPAPPELRQIQEQVGAIQKAVAAAAQTQATGASSLRSDLSAFAAEQSRATQAMRDSLATELRQQETRLRQLTEKFLAESTELRNRIESQSRLATAPRQVTPESTHAAKAELDAEARKEFRKIAERLDSLQTRIEDIIKF